MKESLPKNSPPTKQLLRVPATITKVSTLVDGGLNLVLHTQEIDPDSKALVMDLHNKLGHFVFSASDDIIREEDIPTEPLEEDQKTPSQRLRSVMFVYWKKINEPNPIPAVSFDAFYKQQVEKYIDLIKRKIDEA